MKTPEDVSVEVSALRTQVAALSAMLKADHMALLTFVESLANFCGVTSIEGVSAHAWYVQKRLAELERFLIQLEDSDPGAAAVLQHVIDEIRKPLP